MYDKSSEYALNKSDNTAIVYKDACGNIIRLTAAYFSSEKEFRQWKNWVNMKNHSEEKKEHIHRNHSVSLTGLEELLADHSSFGAFSEEDANGSGQATVTLSQLRAVLTQTQFRRLWKYIALGKTMEEIAAGEGVSIPAVFSSIRSARKKLKSFCEPARKHLKKSPTNRR